MAIVRAFREEADIYQFHDPELLLWSWLLLAKRVPVVYDVHEDYVTAVRQREYMPKPIRVALASIIGVFERVASAPFHRIIAERYYARRFPDAQPILNYPFRDLLDVRPAFSSESNRVLYTGNITLDRGALQIARLVKRVADLEVVAVGECSNETAARMRVEAGTAADRLHLLGDGGYVCFDRIVEQYRIGNWLAGLAIFPDTAHYREKELTKFFEYMAVGLPIIASNFPAWRRLIQNEGVGLCVDPESPHSAAEAIEWLRRNPAEAARMGDRGRELVRTEYNWDREGKKLVGFYRSLTAGLPEGAGFYPREDC
jgi:glycosyltransferase involved in cell wall biosynthesis